MSVRDCGAWIADIDVLGSLPHIINSRMHDPTGHVCSCARPASSLEGEFVTIDNWNELIDIPQTAAIVRSHLNWGARLAISSILHRLHQRRYALLVEERVECWKCLGTGQAWFSEYLDVILID